MGQKWPHCAWLRSPQPTRDSNLCVHENLLCSCHPSWAAVGYRRKCDVQILTWCFQGSACPRERDPEYFNIGVNLMESLLCVIVTGRLRGLGGQRIKRWVCWERLCVLPPCCTQQAFMVDRNGEVVYWLCLGPSLGDMLVKWPRLHPVDICQMSLGPVSGNLFFSPCCL